MSERENGRVELGDERSWRAFRYVTGEMAGAEAAAFELELAHDEAACEAVAEAVELVGAIGLIELGMKPALRVRRAGWREVVATLGAVAALVAILVVGAERYGNGWSNRALVIADQGEGTLGLPLDTVLAWASLRSEGGGESFDVEGELGEAPVADEADDELMPSWMVELAVLDQEADAVGEPPREN